MRWSQDRRRLTRASSLGLALLVFLGWPAGTAAYAVLSHEAIIDSVWDTNIRPLLLKRFPNATPEELKEAHGYAYGGAIIQDMGYYPHGSFFFSDLAHYVRSGDFIVALLRNLRHTQSCLTASRSKTSVVLAGGSVRIARILWTPGCSIRDKATT